METKVRLQRTAAIGISLALSAGAGIGLAASASAAPAAAPTVALATAVRHASVSSPDGFANVRTGPGMGHGIVGSLANGSRVSVYEHRNGWSRIGVNQWVASWLLKHDGDASASQEVLWRVQVGASQSRATADSIAATAQARGFNTYIRKVGSWYRVQVGAFAVRANADAMVARARNAGFADAWARSD